MTTVLERAAHSINCMISLFCLFVASVIFRFGFEGMTLVLIASVPGNCIPFTFNACYTCSGGQNAECPIALILLHSGMFSVDFWCSVNLQDNTVVLHVHVLYDILVNFETLSCGCLVGRMTFIYTLPPTPYWSPYIFMLLQKVKIGNKKHAL